MTTLLSRTIAASFRTSPTFTRPGLVSHRAMTGFKQVSTRDKWQKNADGPLRRRRTSELDFDGMTKYPVIDNPTTKVTRHPRSHRDCG